jgi:hypothetical protein
MIGVLGGIATGSYREARGRATRVPGTSASPTPREEDRRAREVDELRRLSALYFEASMIFQTRPWRPVGVKLPVTA